jgi:hypothetical protein
VHKSRIRLAGYDATMAFLLFAPQALLWLSSALVIGVGGFWLSYVGTCATDSILSSASSGSVHGASQ